MADGPMNQHAQRLPDEERGANARVRPAEHTLFDAIYRKHYDRVARYVWRRTGERHATEDIVSDVFHTALRKLPAFRERGTPIEHWLLRIATRAVLRWARTEGRRRAALERWAELRETGLRPDPAGKGELPPLNVQHLRIAIGTLSQRHQSVLALHYFEGLGVSEIASVLGCRPGTVKSRLSRARQRLAERLANKTRRSR